MYSISINHDLESGKNIYTVTGQLAQYDHDNNLINSFNYSHNFNTKETIVDNAANYDELIGLLSLSIELQDIETYMYETVCIMTKQDIINLFPWNDDIKLSNIIDVGDNELTINLGTVTIDYRQDCDCDITVCNTDVIVVDGNDCLTDQHYINEICIGLINDIKEHFKCESFVFCEIDGKSGLTTDDDIETYKDDDDDTMYFFDDKCNVVVSMSECMRSDGPFDGIVSCSYTAYKVILSSDGSCAVVMS